MWEKIALGKIDPVFQKDNQTSCNQSIISHKFYSVTTPTKVIRQNSPQI